jgi:hypothetical protein
LKTITWTDADGWKHRSKIRDADPDESAPTIGIPCNPPNIREIDWEAVKRDINNLLIDRELTSMADLNKRLEHLRNVPQAVLYQRLIALYQESP